MLQHTLSGSSRTLSITIPHNVWGRSSHDVVSWALHLLRAYHHMRIACGPQGPYVLVLVARGALGTGPEDERRSRLPAMWLIKAYSRLTRPYKKNVRSLVF